MKKSMIKPLSLGSAVVIGAALAASGAAANPFSVNALDNGYEVVAGKKSEGSCGEGSCGGSKKSEGSCGEGSCGGSKKSEGSCGEGSCGGK